MVLHITNFDCRSPYLVRRPAIVRVEQDFPDLVNFEKTHDGSTRKLCGMVTTLYICTLVLWAIQKVVSYPNRLLYAKLA